MTYKLKRVERENLNRYNLYLHIVKPLIGVTDSLTIEETKANLGITDEILRNAGEIE